MLDRLKQLLGGQLPPAPAQPGTPDNLQLAVAALLVEAARLDDHIDDVERSRIDELVQWRFGLDAAAAARLLAEAERLTEGSVPWHGLAAAIRAAYSEGERIRVVEMVWEVVLADGALHPLEDSLLRRLTGLLHLTGRDVGAARERVRDRLGLAS